MAHHYTKNTESVTHWCNRCRGQTLHVVSDGRLGRCMNEHPTKKKPPKAEAPKQALLDFGKTEECWHCGGAKSCDCADCVEFSEFKLNGQRIKLPGICGTCKGAAFLCNQES